jgi:magnesium transporter
MTSQTQSIPPPAPASPSEPRLDDKPEAPPTLWAAAWGPSGAVEQLTSVAQIESAMSATDKVVWIDLIAPGRELLTSLNAILGLHPLVTEDILERNQRAKIELYDDQLNVVMFGLTYEGEILAHEVDIVLGRRFLLSSHEGGYDLRNAPFTRHRDRARIARGPDHVLWGISDWLVDGYFPVFDRIGDEIDDLQADVMRKPNNWVVERIFQVRRDLLMIRHTVSPQREIFNQLTNRDLALIDSSRIVYFRDVYDHLIRLTDELDSYRELVGTTLDIYVSQVNNNLSEIMKRLTGVTVILATIAAVGGIFGMSEAGAAFNFRESAGFWIVTLVTVLIAAGVGFFFRRRGWI